MNLEQNIKLKFKRILEFSGRLFSSMFWDFCVKVFTSSSFFVVSAFDFCVLGNSRRQNGCPLFLLVWGSETLKAMLWKLSSVAWFEKWNWYFVKEKNRTKTSNHRAQTKWRLEGLSFTVSCQQSLICSGQNLYTSTLVFILYTVSHALFCK